MAVVLRFGGQRLRFGGNNLMWSGHIPHFHTKLIIERALQVGAQLPTKLAEFDLYVRDMYPIWMEYHDLYHRYRGDGDPLFKCINLANPDWDLAVPFGGLSWTDEGVRGNGANGYIDTNFNPYLLISGQKYQQNDASRGAVVTNEGTTFASSLIDGTTASQNLMGGYIATVGNRINQSTQNTVDVTDLRGTGFKALVREGIGVKSINKDTFIDTQSTGPTVLNSLFQLILRNAGFYSLSGLSSYFMGKAIPYSVSQDIRAIENADMARLGLPQIA